MKSNDLKQALRQEYIKCGNDPSYFITKYCVIQHPIRGKIPFELYPFQDTTLKELLQHKMTQTQSSIKKLLTCFLWSLTMLELKN